MQTHKNYCALLIVLLICSCFSDKESMIAKSDNHEKIVLANTPCISTSENRNIQPQPYSRRGGSGSYWEVSDLFEFIAFLDDTSIRSLMFYAGTFSDLNPLVVLMELEKLEISMNPNIWDISPLSSLTNLRTLRLFNSGREKSIEPISLLINLQYLDLTFQDMFFRELLPLQQLEVLKLSNRTSLDVTYIAQLHSLRELEITPGRARGETNATIINIEKLGELVNLERLMINGTSMIDISWITSMQNLKRLELRHTSINDISPLLELLNLIDLCLHQSQIRDLTPLLESRSIKKISGPILENGYELTQLFRERGIEFTSFIYDR